jgi:precorrin-8X/cobalt-precorrin-8 methylmutase
MDGSVVAIGNAPTALLEVIRLIEEDGVRPALVIGVPVGFVQAEQSKAALLDLTKQPSITVLGRKGGSSVAVAIIHALIELACPGKK